MFTRLQNLSGHYIVCGGGRTGSEVVDELLRGGCRNVVVIEQDRELLERLSAKHGESFIGLLGDATEDGALRDAGVERAAGIATTLQKDQDNLFVALSARQLNAKLRIVSRGVADRATPKLLLAGADSVVNPTNIGGRRMAHELLHRNVVGFLDLMTRYSERNLSIEDVAIPEDSPLCGRQIRQSKIREVSNALVLAVVGAGGRSHVFNPGPDYVLDAGMTITVLGEREEVLRLKKHVDPQHIDSTPPPSRWGVLARRERL